MEKYIATSGCRVAYEHIPGSRPGAVILLHGYGLHRAMWEPQIDCLQDSGYTVINIDVRGHGRSRPTEAFSVKLAAEDVHAIIEQEGLGPIVLCGLSMGAFVVQEYAFQFGAAAGYMLTGATPLFIPYPLWEKKLLAFSGTIMKYGYTWNGLKHAMTKGSAFTEPAARTVARLFDEIGKEEFLVSWRGFTTCLHEETYSFDAPLKVLAGERDTRGSILKLLPEWTRHYPGCSVETIPHAGHVANLDQPAAFNLHMLAFAERCLSR